MSRTGNAAAVPGTRALWGTGRRTAIAVFVAPALLFYLLLTIYPVLQTIYNSLFEIRPRSAWIFLGAQNYAQLAGDRTFCIYLAEDEGAIREHAKISGFPANRIVEIKRVIDPSTAKS